MDPPPGCRGITQAPCRAASRRQDLCAARRGIIHRDVKASNVILVPTESWLTVKLLDFGIAKLMFEDPTNQLTRTGMRIGTPSTMAPEQLLCQPGDAARMFTARGFC